MKTIGYTCASCGYRNLKLPQRSPSGGASYEICPACGFESGFTDDDQNISFEQWREKWVAEGCRWFSSSISRPKLWNPLKDIHSLMRRKRPVVPPIRMKRAAAIKESAPPPESKKSKQSRKLVLVRKVRSA